MTKTDHKKKVLILFHSLDRLAGGVDNRVSELELSLSQMFNTEFLLYKPEINLPHHGEIFLVPLFPIPSIMLKCKEQLRWLGSLLGVMVFIFRAMWTRQFLKKNPSNTVLAFDDYFGAIAILAAWGLKKRVIVSVRNSWKHLYGQKALIHLMPDGFYRYIVKYLYIRKPAAIHCVSRGIAKELNDAYGIKRTRVIYHLLNFDGICQLANALVDVPKQYIVTVGNLKYQKNQKDILIAFSLMKKARIPHELFIVGDGPLRSSLEMLSRQLGIHGNVHFTGKVQNPYPYIRHATLLLLSSHFEGFPSVVVEAAILNTAVVSYDCDHGPKELIQNVIPPDPAALAQTAISLLTCDHQREKAVIQQRHQVMTLFNRDIILAKWQKLLMET